MSTWTATSVGHELELAYGKALPAHAREVGPFPVFGSNGCVGHHATPLTAGPGIIVGRKGSVGAVAYSEGDFWPIDTTYYVVNKGGHDWRYLFHLLSSLGLDQLNSHSAVPGLNREDVHSIAIALPGTHEQREIASVLDLVERQVRLETHLVAQAQELKRASMHSLFTRGLRREAQKESEIGLIPGSWELQPLGSHFAVASGGTPSRQRPEYWLHGTIPWVKTTEIDYGVILDTEEHISQSGLAASAAKLLPVGTILLAMYGQGATRGRVAILGTEAACNQACAAIRPMDSVLGSKYLYHFLVYRYEQIRQLAHGGQQQNLNLEIVRSIQVGFPTDKGEQEEISTVLDSIDRQIALHRQKRVVLDELFRALLHKLMSGGIRVGGLDLSALESTPSEGAVR